MSEIIEKYLNELKEVEQQLASSEVVQDQKKFKELSMRHAFLMKIHDNWIEQQKTQKALADNKELLKSSKDDEWSSILIEEIETDKKRLSSLDSAMQEFLVPPDPRDNRSIIMELRAGTGGDEAALFVGDCYRMYRMFSDKMGWQFETLSAAESEAGGYKEVFLRICGQGVFRYMQYEAGTHRVQRVPETETQGRIHTSAITVAVLIEPDEEEQVKINEADLKIDTFRASGAGGQHVNTTDSAVRITHLPTGIVVGCQQERSQIKNREKALKVLAAKIAEEEREKKNKEESQLRQQQVGSGDRSGRIRTYNFPQNRMTDHRINLTLYNLNRCMEGELEEIISPLISYFYQKKLESL